MNINQQAWQKLAAAARDRRDQRDETAPYGFTVRIASRAFAQPTTGALGLLEKFAVCGLIAACILSLAAMALGSTMWTGDHEEEVASTDFVGEILDLS